MQLFDGETLRNEYSGVVVVVRGQSLCEMQQCVQRLQEQRGMKEEEQGEQGSQRNRG